MGVGGAPSSAPVLIYRDHKKGGAPQQRPQKNKKSKKKQQSCEKITKTKIQTKPGPYSLMRGLTAAPAPPSKKTNPQMN
jgi:hypothetical protein